jgi:hypothetical protein
VKTGFLAAWLVGEGVLVWRLVNRDHRLPPPGALLGVTALFAALGLVAEYQPAAGVALAMAVGLDVAAVLNVLPQGLGGQITQAEAAEAKEA